MFEYTNKTKGWAQPMYAIQLLRLSPTPVGLS